MEDPARLHLAAEVQELQSRRYRIGSVTLHWHDFYEIEVVTDGMGTHTANGKTYEWRRGEMHLLCPVDVHEITLEAWGELPDAHLRSSLSPNISIIDISNSIGLPPQARVQPKCLC